MTVFSGTVSDLLTGGPATSTPLAAITGALKALSEAQTSWSPAWTSDTTQPVVNNGTLTGKYLQVGKFVVCSFQLVAGSTTTYGTGNYFMSLPVPATGSAGQVLGDSTCYFLDNSTSGNFLGSAIYATTSTIRVRVHGTTANWGPTVPATMATSDRMCGGMIYEAA